jgi:ribosomal protein S18 acetylase RimI-like enzyme
LERLTLRKFSGAQDLQAMLDLLVAVRPPERITDFPSPVDLRELLALNVVQANTRLWFSDNDHMVAFTFVDHYQNLRFEIDQWAAHPALEIEIMNWGVDCVRGAMKTTGEVLTLDASCRADDAEKIAFFERHGFVKQDIRSLRMLRSLAEPVPDPLLPSGFRIRHVAGEHEAQTLVDLHRAAFGTENMSLEERLAMMDALEYDPELDLLVIAPDGRIAAYCMCTISQEENQRSGRNEGFTDPVATHPDYQRLGLAKALLLSGMQKLKQRGVGAAVLGTSSENIAMQRVAQAVGFQVQSTTLWFVKPVT